MAINPNPFARWVEHTGLRPGEIARVFKVLPSEITRYSKPKYWPPRKTAIMIFKLTGGAVSPNDFMGPKITQEVALTSREFIAARDLMVLAGNMRAKAIKLEEKLNGKRQGIRRPYLTRKRKAEAAAREQEERRQSGDGADRT